jgi:hypothetical protein
VVLERRSPDKRSRYKFGPWTSITLHSYCCGELNFIKFRYIFVSLNIFRSVLLGTVNLAFPQSDTPSFTSK